MPEIRQAQKNNFIILVQTSMHMARDPTNNLMTPPNLIIHIP